MTDISPSPRQTTMTSRRLRETPGAKAGDPSARGQKTAKFDRKLVVILRAASAVFAEVGFDPASIRMVADRAGVSVAGLYYYVRSKDELLYLIQYHVFDDLVRRFEADCARMVAAGGAQARPQARLERFINNHLDHFLADMPSLTVCTRELGRLSGEYLQQVESLQRTYFFQAFEIFRELGKAEDHDWVDPRAATMAMFGAINWVSTWYDPANDKSAGELAREFARLFLRGVSPGVGQPAETSAGAAGPTTPAEAGTGAVRRGRGRR